MQKQAGTTNRVNKNGENKHFIIDCKDNTCSAEKVGGGAVVEAARTHTNLDKAAITGVYKHITNKPYWLTKKLVVSISISGFSGRTALKYPIAFTGLHASRRKMTRTKGLKGYRRNLTARSAVSALSKAHLSMLS